MKYLKLYKNNTKLQPKIVEFKRKRSGYHRFINFRKILICFLPILLIAIVYLAVTRLDLTKDLVLRHTEYEGLNRLTKAELDSTLEDKFGKSMLGMNMRELENRLTHSFIEISEIRAEKIYPDQVKFKIKEKTATLEWINFNGRFLLDNNGEVLKSICREDKQKFSAFDYLMARGFGNPNAEYVEDAVISNIPEDVKLEEFDFSKFPYEEKLKILQNFEKEKNELFDKEIAQIKDNYDLNINFTVPITASWSEDCFKQGDKLDKALVDFISAVITDLSGNQQYNIEQILWDGEFRLFVKLATGTTIIFSPSRDLKLQLNDLISVLSYTNKNINEYRIIDLSSQKVAIE